MASQKNTFVCGACGYTKQVAKGARTPSCCGKPMKLKKK